MIKKCLIIVPHPDDEINVAGGLFRQLEESEINVTVAICTNGDYIPQNADVRIRETLKAKKILRYDNLVILGYGDDYKKNHIYISPNNEVVTSKAGYHETYNAGGLNTYHYNRYKCQCTYTRENYKNDIKQLILDISADVLICVDTDNHPDHRAVSLLFDEAMGEILRSTSYHPIVLKKFAYLGVYFGIEDYFSAKMVETLPSYGNNINEKYSYPYDWNERIRFANDSKNYPLSFWRSPIFKSLLCHRSQNAYLQYVNICNSDLVYWFRSTESISYTARIEASSGDISFLNDFKIVDTDDIGSQTINIEPSLTKAWIPDREEKKHKVKFTFERPSELSFIIIHQSPSSHISQIDVLIDDKKTLFFNCEKTNILKVEIPLQIGIKFIELSFNKACLSEDIAIYEIELFKVKPQFPWGEVPFLKYKCSSNIVRSKFLLKLYSWILELYHSYRILLYKKIRPYWWRLDYRLNRILMNKYKKI